MRWFESILQTNGYPLDRLSKVTGGLPVAMLATVEHFNSAGNVKDRTAFRLI